MSNDAIRQDKYQAGGMIFHTGLRGPEQSNRGTARNFGVHVVLAVLVVLGVLVATPLSAEVQANANRLSYLAGDLDPYYVHRGFAKLVTPQWIGEEDVEAVVVLAIDDMRDSERYERFLRPILNRLKLIDGRAPVSIMTNQIDPADAQVQRWLAEGLSIEVHTYDHPCPLLQGGDFARAKQTYDRCVDLLSQIPGNTPVAFRMPCCDSLNTPSPRFWREIFNKRTPSGRFLTIDSSVFNITTPDDDKLPQDWTKDPDGRPRFGKYLPFPSFVNTIKDYPYPYVIGNLCWEFPCMVPSDWEAQNLHRPNNPKTVEDLKRALDVVVRKQGVFNLVFHPHGWIRSDQIVELIDYAQGRYGNQVKFLNFQEAHLRLKSHFLADATLRDRQGRDEGIRILDVNNDGFMDVFQPLGNGHVKTRVWIPQERRWLDSTEPLSGNRYHFGVVSSTGAACVVTLGQEGMRLFEFNEGRWQPQRLRFDSTGIGLPPTTLVDQPHRLDAVRMHDLNANGRCELIMARGDESLIAEYTGEGRWRFLPFGLPKHVQLSTTDQDSGLRLIDINEDGKDDCLFSTPGHYSLHLFASMEHGWATTIVDQRRASSPSGTRQIPTLVRPDGSSNGFWFHSSHLWWQNEDTDRLPDKVDRMAFADLLAMQGQHQQDDAEDFPDATLPEDALGTMRLPAGFEIELVASEPLIADPIAFDFGPDGRLWVVEMGDYPNGIDGQGKAGGKIKVLEDRDGDGRFDHSTVFLNDLPFPTAVKVWRKGILVAAAPEVFYAEDTDGDDRADVRKVLFRGFGEGNQQHRVNGLIWGQDNWVYLANGDSGGQIESVRTGEEISVSGRDLRVRPDTGAMQTLSGQTQFGRCCDDFGNWFGGNNSYPMWHYVIEDRYAKRNPHYAVPTVRKQVSDQPGPAPVFPVSRTLPRFNDFDRADRFTSACSPHIYRDDRIADGQPIYYVCEPVHNLVHREVMRVEGATFASQRLASEQNSEFLASTDNWFRPVMIRTGPDGALWVADMYRLVIEHPTWIPQHWQQRLDVRAGHDRGRIYRVIRSGQGGQRKVPRFDQLPVDQLVSLLDQPNGCQRDLAHQLILWRDDSGVASLVEPLVRHARHAAASIHALYILDYFDRLSVATIRDRIVNGDPRVARAAMEIAEPHLDRCPALVEAISGRSESADDALLMQVICSLGQTSNRVAAETLARLAQAHYDDPILFPALLTSLHESNIGAIVRAVLWSNDDEAPQALVTALVEQSIALGDERLTFEVVDAVVGRSRQQPSKQLAALASLLESLRKRSISIASLPQQVQTNVTRLINVARELALDANIDSSRRIQAIQLLHNDVGDAAANLDALRESIEPQQPLYVQSAAVSTIVQRFPQDAVGILLHDWSSRSPRIRNQILDEIIRRPKMILQLLTYMSEHPTSIVLHARHRQRLFDSTEVHVRQRVRAMFGNDALRSREEVISKYAQALSTQGDAARGRLVFEKNCTTCHRLGDQGHPVGPDLVALTNRSAEALLTAILDPNRAVEEVYYNYVVEMDDGQQFSGIVSAETGNSITLTAAESKQYSILRHQIETLHSTGKSLMPEGLEQDMSPRDINDLIAFLRLHRLPPKQFEGNRPQLAPMRDDGSIRLFAMHARIYGPSLVFESRYRNLGFWAQQEDHAVWEVNIPEAREYDVRLDYACDDSCAGNRFVISSNDQQIGGEVEGTGTWDDYRSAHVGTLRLPAGRSEILFRSEGPVRSFLIDLRTIFLFPTDD